MNYTKAKELISRVLDDNEQDNICVFLDGQWGIGKSYTIREWAENNKEKYELKYISVFGKNSLPDIEKSIILQMVPLINTVHKKLDKTKTAKVGVGLGINILQSILSKDLNLSNFLNNISVEDCIDIAPKGKKVIICIDDLERKSDSVSLKDILGLIERIKGCFGAILIGNSHKISEVSFNEYKEKVIDYEFIIDELDSEIVKDIVFAEFEGLSDKDAKRIMDSYFSNRVFTIDFDKKTVNKKRTDISLYNLRLLKKYIRLVKRVNKKANELINRDPFIIGDELLVGCADVIKSHFLVGDKENVKNEKASFDRKSLSFELNNIFLFNNYNSEVILDSLQSQTEIREDVIKLFNIYKMNNSEYDDLLKKISEKIKLLDKDYFINQRNVISIYDALVELNIGDQYVEDLYNVALLLTDFKEKPTLFNEDDWVNCTFFGFEPCSPNTLRFIKRINSINIEKFNDHLINKYKNAIETKNFTELEKILQQANIGKIINFETIFELTFDEIDKEFSEEWWKLLIDLIYKTDNEITGSYFSERAKKEENPVRRSRYRQLDIVLGEKMYNEHLAEQYEERIQDEE